MQYKSLFSLTLLIGLLLSAHTHAQVIVNESALHHYMTADKAGQLHIVYFDSDRGSGVYRSAKYNEGGDPLFTLSYERVIQGATPFNNPRVQVDNRGRVHLVFQKGNTGAAKTSWYTYLHPDSTHFIHPEKFADVADLGGNRAYMPDVAADSLGNVLVAFWNPVHEKNTAKYRWRTKNGIWSQVYGDLTDFHAGTPKVESHDGSFYLYYAESDYDKRILVSDVVGEPFSKDNAINTGSNRLGLSIQNEGINFIISAEGKIAAAGNVRSAFAGPVGLWVSQELTSTEYDANYFGPYFNTVRGDESSLHPNLTFNEADGSVLVASWNPFDELSYVAGISSSGVKTTYERVNPNSGQQQGYLRNGPSLADIPGDKVAISHIAGSRLSIDTISYAGIVWRNSIAAEAPGVNLRFIENENAVNVFISKIKLNWKSYVIERASSRDGDYTQIANISSDRGFFIDRDVEASKTYFYRAYSLGEAQRRSASSEVVEIEVPFFQNIVADVDQKTRKSGSVVYPNPMITSSNFLTITSKQVIQNILLTDIDGKRIMKVRGVGSKREVLPLEGIQNGIYFISINNREPVKTVITR